MALFPVQVFTKNNVKARWREPFTSEAVNKKFLGIPKGVYLGFNPVPNAGDPVNLLDLTLDISEAVSVLRAKSTVSQTAIDLIVEETVTLDFTGHVVFPVYVYAEVVYEVGAETTASIKTSSTAPNGLTQIGICKITAPNIGGSTLGVDHLQFDPENAPDRHAPIANTGVPFGFMTGGAEQDRQRAVLTSDEVDAAREDTVLFTHPLLQARLTADFDPTRIAANQGRSIEALASNDRIGVTGSSINVSPSFSFKGRLREPIIDILGGGSEAKNGAITEVVGPPVDPATSDTVRNIVLIQDIPTGRPYVDPSTGKPVFGRLKFDEVADGTSTLTFTNGNPVVTRTAGATDLTTIYDPSDLIKDPDGNYYVVLSVVATSVTLTSAWVAVTAAITQTIQRRRFTVEFFTRTAGADAAYSVVRTCIVDTGLWVGTDLGVNAPGTFESYTTDISGSAGTAPTAGIVRQAYAPGNQILYVPDDPAVVIGGGDTITGGTSGNTAEAVAGTPTIDPPDLRFYFAVFQDISQSRSSGLVDFLGASHPEIPRANENVDGHSRYAPHLGVERFTGLQASDPRILTQDEKDAAANATAPSSGNPFVTESASLPFDLVSKAAAFGRWAKSGEFVAAAPARTVLTFGSEDSDNHASQLFSTVIPGTGVITLTRPPTGIRYIYTVEFIGFGSNVAGTSMNFFIAATGSTLPISNTAQEGNVNAQWNGTANAKAHFTVDSVAAGALFPNLIEIQRQTGAGSTAPTNTTSKLFISRVARVE